MAECGFRFGMDGSNSSGNTRFWRVIEEVAEAAPAFAAVAVRLHAYERASQARDAAESSGWAAQGNLKRKKISL